MKMILPLLASALMSLGACNPAPEARVMARFVPERYDDFVFENNLIAGRFYGEALESCGRGQLTSPGIDIWVKVPGALVCNQRYVDDLQNKKSYHKDWGNGKDCYKVSRTLGGGASSVLIDGQLQMPATNFRSWEIVEEGPEKVVFVLNYPEWEVKGEKISLSKKVTVVPDTYFCKVEDLWTFSGELGDTLPVAAGINRHPKQNTVEQELNGTDRYAIWEKASDTGAEPEDGMLGVAVIVPGAEQVLITEDGVHGLVVKQVKSGEPLTYYFGSCWSKGNLKTAAEWFDEVEKERASSVGGGINSSK